MTPADSAPPARKLGLALRRGLRGRCPACGEARLFGRFLKPAACPGCGQDWAQSRADDFPAYLVVLATGHLLVPIVVEANIHFTLSTGFQMIAWPGLAAILALLLIQPMKGLVIGLQWAR